MNREIKFRAWDTYNERMVEDPYYFRENTNAPIRDDERFNAPMEYAENWQDVDDGIWRPCHIMQFTGKLGHNDRELYEGDIVFYEEAGDNGDERHWLVIVWIPEWSMFASVFIDEYLKFLEKGAEALDEVMFWTYTLQESENYHYAGNIYENPKLLTNG